MPEPNSDEKIRQWQRRFRAAAGSLIDVLGCDVDEIGLAHAERSLAERLQARGRAEQTARQTAPKPGRRSRK